MSIEILPQSQLSFHRPFTQLVKEIIIVRNPNHEPVSFKIKTTAPKQYCVRPNMGRIEPNQSVEIQIILQPMKEDPPIDFKCKDKFMIQSIGIIPEHETLSLEELWAITSKDLINEKKLRCEYLPPVGNNPFPTLTSPIHSHNIAEPFRNDDDDPAKLRRQLLEAKDEITRLNNMIENYKQELNTTQMRQRKDEEAAASFEKLSNYYLKLLNDKEDFNVIINVGMSPDIKIFQAHSNILRNRSLYFRKELARISKDENNIKTINLKNVSIQQFEIIIKYIYGGVVLLESQHTSFIFELMLVASEFFLDELTKHLETRLIRENAHWLRLHFARIYRRCFQNINLQELQNWCNDIVAKYPDTIFESEDFIYLPENALISLLKRDDLQMVEGKIWDHVIRWGIAQSTDLPPDPKDWSHENFLTLKTIVKNCLPLIRYFQISNDDIVDKVKPYKKILEKNLWDDILLRFISPNRQISSMVLPPRKILTPTLPSRENDSIPIERNSSTSYVDNNLDFSKLTLIDHPNVNDEHITHGGSTSYINSNLVFNKLIDPQKEALSSSSPTSHTEEESDVDKNDPSNEVIMQLINMGFSKAQAIDALEKNNYDPYQAITYLLNSDI